MKNLIVDLLPCNFSAGKYYAVIVDCYGDELADGIVAIYMDLLLVKEDNREIFAFCDTVVNHNGNPRSKDFFDFLIKSNIQFEDYHELTGLVFSTEIIHEQIGNVVMPILTNRNLL